MDNKKKKKTKKKVVLRSIDAAMGIAGGFIMGGVSIWLCEVLMLPQIFGASASASFAFVVCVAIWASGFREKHFDEKALVAIPIKEANEMPWVSRNFATFCSPEDDGNEEDSSSSLPAKSTKPKHQKKSKKAKKKKN